MPASKYESLSATGSVYLPKPAADTLVNVQVNGTYGTVSLVFEGSLNGATSAASWFALPAGDMTTGASNVTGTVSPIDNATYAWRIPCEGCLGVRVRVTAIASGTINVGMQSYPFNELPTGSAQSTNAFSQSIAGTLTITSASATALTCGLAGATNPCLQVDNSTASSATGLKIKSAAAAGGVALSVISSGAAENLTIDAKGTGTITLNGTATGTVTIGSTLTMADAKNIILNTSTGTKIGTATTQKLAFYNSTPITQPAASTDTTTGAAGGTTTVFLNTTYTGGVGSAAYTVGGIVASLKNLGLIAS